MDLFGLPAWDHLLHPNGRLRIQNENRVRYLNSMAVLQNSGNQSITDATVTTLTWDTELVDTDNLHSTAANTSRITPKIAGKYLVGGLIRYDARSDYSALQLRIHKNGTQVAFAGQQPNTSAADTIYLPGVFLLTAVVGDYFELATYQDNTGSAASNVTADFTQFYLVYLGE